MQNVSDDFADAVSDGPDCPDVSQANDQPLKHRLEVAAFSPDGRLSGLTQQAAREAIAVGGERPE